MLPVVITSEDFATAPVMYGLSLSTRRFVEYSKALRRGTSISAPHLCSAGRVEYKNGSGTARR